MITAAADGSALGNPGPAGWAWYVDDVNWDAGGWKHATNNQGELQAVLELFRATAHVDDDLLILCDSQYVINCVSKWMRGWKAKGWRKADGKPVMNVEILKEIDTAISGRRYRFEWVKGHANHPLNEAADTRARAVSEAFQRGAAIPVGPGYVAADTENAAEAGPLALRSPARPAFRATGAAPEIVSPPEIAKPQVTAPPPTRVRLRAEGQPLLFDLDDEQQGADGSLETLTLKLEAVELGRLRERARRTGLSPEQFLRGLI